MARQRILPPTDDLVRMVQSGMTHEQIAEKVRQDTGEWITTGAVHVALHRAGKTKERARYHEELPWRVETEHLMAYPARMLRLLGRRRSGQSMTEAQGKSLDSWLEHLEREHAVVAYSPERGFLYVPKRDGLDGADGIPIRRAHVTARELA